MSKQGAEIAQFLGEKWEGRPCPLCKVGNWSVTDNFFELMEYNGNIVGGKVVPVIPVTCTNCGNTVLISAISTGFLKT